jgi:cytochrome c oxidase assembly factor CtaG
MNSAVITLTKLLIAIGLLAAAGSYSAAFIDLRRHNRLAGLRSRGLIRDFHPVLFGVGLAAIAIAVLSPLDTLAGLRFSAHMVQHMLMMMVAAPALLLGLPSPFARGALGRRWIRQILDRLSDPLIAYFAFNANLLLWHIPRLYQLALVNPWIHDLQHALFFYTALLVWWRVIDPTRGWFPLWRWAPARWVYLLVFAPPSYALGAVLWGGGWLLYPYYAAVGAMFQLTALADQRLGGLFMWIQGWMFLMLSMFVFYARYDPELEEA